jgi:hypothetical protein
MSSMILSKVKSREDGCVRRALHSLTIDSGLTIDSSVLEAKNTHVAPTKAGSNSTKLYL